jgi:hypothetical protein
MNRSKLGPSWKVRLPPQYHRSNFCLTPCWASASTSSGSGLKAFAQSAPQDARGWLERALGVLEALPESPSTLEQDFEIPLELRPVLVQLGEVRWAQERLREAETLAERVNDEGRRGRVCAFITVARAQQPTPTQECRQCSQTAS